MVACELVLADYFYPARELTDSWGMNAARRWSLQKVAEDARTWHPWNWKSKVQTWKNKTPVSGDAGEYTWCKCMCASERSFISYEHGAGHAQDDEYLSMSIISCFAPVWRSFRFYSSSSWWSRGLRFNFFFFFKKRSHLTTADNGNRCNGLWSERIISCFVEFRCCSSMLASYRGVVFFIFGLNASKSEWSDAFALLVYRCA